MRVIWKAAAILFVGIVGLSGASLASEDEIEVAGQLPTEAAANLPFEVTVAFDYAGDIYITDFSDDPMRITPTDTYDMIPAWSPDGTQIAFLSSDSYLTWNESHLSVITLATGELRPLSDWEFSSETTLTWSPDGRYIAATLGTIFIVDVESGEASRLPVDCGMCSVNWLPDSSGLIFDGHGEIFQIGLDGDNLQQITHAQPSTYRPALSPVSDEVVFASSYEDVPGLYLVSLDDLTVNRVVDLSVYNVLPHLWSPDGQYIAFGVFPVYSSDVVVPGGGDVYIVNKDGTDMRVVTSDGSDSLIGWVNDSQHVIYYEGEPGGASGSYFAVNIFDGIWTRLSGEVMDGMCSYGNCRNFTIRP
jgi:Tol biopolymer transport system component